ncbi:uncharacterized protein LOC105835272 isoform X2 [Monomorium pharaonis]|uniref:uncharacterized protein LOC105835272 isoform X2 n=1 Tax=Monomorium pharaonis TaxID=307658 RepID=UPI0017475AEB|nr:uncharacterized protein LOC105835272 isoform X2 [Monomorium pharaonis]
METHARPPSPLRKDGDMASNWQNWKEEFIIFMKVANYMEQEPSDKRANCLKNFIGRVGIEAIRNITFDSEQDKDDMDILIEKLDKYFIPTKNEVFERHQFFTASKWQNESIEHYVTLLKEKAKNCNFKDLTDSIIRDKIILDTQDKILRQKFLEADDLNLSKLIAIYNDYTNTERRKQFTQFSCWRCGTQHPIRQCPAWGTKCKDCNIYNHYTGRCPDPKKYIKSTDKVNKNVFDETQKFTPKKNNDKWNIQPADFTVITDSITFPEIPTAPCDSDNENASVDKDSIFDFPKNKHLQFWNDSTMNHSANLPEKPEESCLYKKFPVKPDITRTTNFKLQNDTMNHSSNLLKKTESLYKKFPVKPDETHTTSLKLQNDTMNHSANLPKKIEDSYSYKKFSVKPNETHIGNLKLRNYSVNSSKKTEDSHSHKNFATKPDGTHANSKSWNDNITGHSANLFKSTLKQDETHNTNSRSWCDNSMNHSANSSKSTQTSHSYKSFTVKPNGTLNTNSKSLNDNNTTHSAYLPNTQHGCSQFAQHTSDKTILHRANLPKNKKIQKKEIADCVVL